MIREVNPIKIENSVALMKSVLIWRSEAWRLTSSKIKASIETLAF